MRKVTINKVLVFLFCLSAYSLYGSNGIRFIENRGQWNHLLLYASQFNGGSIYIEKNAFVFQFVDEKKLHLLYKNDVSKGVVNEHTIRMKFIGADASSVISRDKPFDERYNYFVGDEKKWVSGVKAYQILQTDNLYDGVDMELQSMVDFLFYSLVAEPGGSSQNIKIAFEGADLYDVDSEGNLVIQTSMGDIVSKATAYQVYNNQKFEIAVRYKIKNGFVVFDFPKGMEPEAQLIIQPKIYLKPHNEFKAHWGFAATYDHEGNSITAGTDYELMYPVKPGAEQFDVEKGIIKTPWQKISRDIVISKTQKNTSNQKFITFLGGSENERPYSLAVNSVNEIVIFGSTRSEDFAITKGSFDDSINGNNDLFLSKLTSNGSFLTASTFIGGNGDDGINGSEYDNSVKSPLRYYHNDLMRGEVAIDESDNIYATTVTKSKDFPVTTNAVQGKFLEGGTDGVVFSLDGGLKKLRWSTFIGGKGIDAAYSVSISGNMLYITGSSNSSILAHSLINSNNDDINAYVLKFSLDDFKVVEGKFLGSKKFDQAYFVRVIDNKVYLTGVTEDSKFFQVKTAYKTDNGKHFIMCLDENLNVLYSSTFGKSETKASLSPMAFDVDDEGIIYFAGWAGELNDWGDNKDLDLTENAYQKNTDNNDIYVAAFSPNMKSLEFGTYYGNNEGADFLKGGMSRFSNEGDFYLDFFSECGDVASASIPGVIIPDNSFFFNCDQILTQIHLPLFKIDFESSAPVCLGDEIHFTNHTLKAREYFWDFGDGNLSNEKDPNHLYQNPGVYKVKLVALGQNEKSKFIIKEVTVYGLPDPKFTFGVISNLMIQFIPQTKKAIEYQWDFGDQSNSSEIEPVHNYISSGSYNVKLFVEDTNSCSNSYSMGLQLNENTYQYAEVNIRPSMIEFPNPFSSDLNLIISLPYQSDIGVSIIGVEGEQEYDLYKNTLEKGKYTVKLNSSDLDLQSGFYFLKVVINGRIYYRKVSKL